MRIWICEDPDATNAQDQFAENKTRAEHWMARVYGYEADEAEDCIANGVFAQAYEIDVPQRAANALLKMCREASGV